jgi:hypothetical protein
MTKDQLNQLFDKVRSLNPDRQADVSRFVDLIAAQDASGFHLTSEQVAELRRRIAEDDGERIPADEVFQRIRSRRR